MWPCIMPILRLSGVTNERREEILPDSCFLKKSLELCIVLWLEEGSPKGLKWSAYLPK